MDLTAHGLSLCLLLQTLELWLARDALRVRFPWRIVQRDYPRWLDWLLREQAWTWLLAAQAGLGVALSATGYALIPWLALAAALLQAARFRGTFNGGSDAMTLVLLVGLALARTPWLPAQLGLGYIAAQLVLSYFVAGVWKLRAADWRAGTALAAVLRTPQYRAPVALPRFFARAPEGALRRLGRWAGYGVIAFECAFPLALMDARLAAALLALGATFHLANALLLGLNRFLWAWLAAYPALWYWAQA